MSKFFKTVVALSRELIYTDIQYKEDTKYCETFATYFTKTDGVQK